MATIKSKHKGPLGIPGGITLRPGVETNVENWPKIKNHAVVRQWLNAKVLEVVNDDEPDADASGDGGSGNDGGKAPLADEGLAALKAEAKELGIAVHYRWSAEKIQEEIDKKLGE